MHLVDDSRPSRDLVRTLRTPMVNGSMLPESVLWQTFIELKRRGEPNVDRLFIGAVRLLHSRRCIGAGELPTADDMPDEHRLVDDPFLADLWKAYKKCITSHRTGPASQLLRDIEERLQAS